MRATFLGLIILALCGCSTAPREARGLPTLAIAHVNVVDVVSGRVILDQTVFVEGDTVTAVRAASGATIPQGTRSIDGRGRYLIPGLWDMHVHSSSDRITRETFLPMYVAHGITGVRDTRGDCFEPCTPLSSPASVVRQWRSDIEAGRLIGPRIVAGSPFINGPRRGAPSTVQRPGNAADARAAVNLVRERGADFVKIGFTLPREAYFALAGEANRQGIPFVGHLPFAVRASEASAAGQRSMEHLWGIVEECSAREDELRPRLLRERAQDQPSFAAFMLMLGSFDEEKCRRLYASFAANRTWQVPTLAAFAAELDPPSGSDPRFAYVAPEERSYWVEAAERQLREWPDGRASLVTLMDRRRAIVGALSRAGVPILAGSDAGFPGVFVGSGLHEELALLVEAGLTPAEALRTATLNPAIFLNQADRHGAVTIGRVADLVLLQANPLSDIRNSRRIEAVFLRGRYFDRAALDGLLNAVERAARPENP